jgi:hypothetical protein
MMQRVDFYGLSRAVQDRFIGCARGESQPTALLSAEAEMSRDLPIFASVVTGGLVGIVLLLHWGFGDLDSSVAIQPRAVVILYLVAIFAVLLGGLRLAQRWREASVLPFRAGVYLFPSGVIDARDHQLRIFSMTSLVESGPNDRAFRLTFADGTAFALPVRDRKHAEQVDAALRQGKEALLEAIEAEDKKRLGLLDPLQDIGLVNPFGPNSIAPKMPVWVRQTWVMVALGALVLAPLLWSVRNWASDKIMLRAANRAHTADAYRAYIAAGGRDPEVKPVLLARAELAEATRQGSAEAIEKYMAEHPDSRIGEEATAALRQALLAELDRLRKMGSLLALTDFAKRHPQKIIESELREATHATYQAALAQYRKESGVKDPAARAFIEELLAAAEKRGPKVVLRFRRQSPRSMELVDRRVRLNPRSAGPVQLPSQYFDDAHAEPREAAAAKTIIERFSSAFPADLLAFELGPSLGAAMAQEGPVADAPTMLIEHVAEPSGALYFSARPKGVFAGIDFVFDVTWLLPGSSRSHTFHTSLWRRPRPMAALGAEKLEETVYESMAESAFDQFSHRYLAVFFPNQESGK